MQAIKLQGHINSDRTLHLSLPEGVSEGPAEVIVLLDEAPVVNGRDDLKEFLRSLRQNITEKKSWEEIQAIVEDERNSWD